MTSLHDYPGAILGTTERSLLGWMDAHVKRGETWLDIGAHYGYTTLALSARVGPQGRVFAFEPVVATAGCIARTRTINEMAQITIVPLALSDNAGVQLQRMPLVRGMADGTVRSSVSESFLASNLDWLWPQISSGQAQIDGVKIDVQGAELAVLKGMSGLLSRWVPKLVIEFHSGVDRQEILAILASAGYRPAAIPLERKDGDLEATILDDKSYSFLRSGDQPAPRDEFVGSPI